MAVAVEQIPAAPALDLTAPPGSSKEHVERLKLKAAFFAVHGYTPHEQQWRLIHARSERYKVLCWPRQHGKSMGEAWEAIFFAAEKPRRKQWIVAPNYDLCEPIFDEIHQAQDRLIYPAFRITKSSYRDWYVEFSNGSRIDGKSAEVENTLQGRALHRLTVEEAASIHDPKIYQQYLRPALAVHGAEADFISTPKGFDWFFDLAQRGQDPLQPDYFFGRAPLGCSPYIKREEIEEARRTLPKRVFQQEYEAEFVSDAGAVFRGVVDCIRRGHEKNEKPVDGRMYAGGIDLAKLEDFSVITIVDRTKRRQVYFDRFNEVDWHRQIVLFSDVAKSYGDCPVLVDSTGVGEPIYEFMRKCGMRVYPYNFCGDRKEDLMNNLALSIERRELGLLDLPVQTNELVGYEYQRTKLAGKLRMGAAGSQHDDTVTALALAWWQASQGTGQVTVTHRGWRL